MKYGGNTEEEALAAITWNAAADLGLETRIGSIEVGKDADLAVFSRHPFDPLAVCEMTFIDGELFFSRERDLEFRKLPSPVPTAENPVAEVKR
jgi:imidazolonepropionase-like amidohydrolase